MINIQVTKALCMSINGFFQKNANQLLSVISKRIENISAEGNVTKEIIENSKTKLQAAVSKILDSEDFKKALVEKMATQLKTLNIPIACTSNGNKILGGSSKTRRYKQTHKKTRKTK